MAKVAPPFTACAAETMAAKAKTGAKLSTMAAPEELVAIGLKHMKGAYAAEAQTKRAAAAEARARKEKDGASCKVTIGIGTADAVRQLLFKQAKLRKQNGESVDGDDIILRNYKSMAAYNSYANEQLRPDEDEQISVSAFKSHVRNFWLFAHKWALLEFGGATIERDAFDRDQWTDKGPSSTVYAESSTLEYVLAEGFAESLRVRIPAGSLNELVAEASGKPARVYAKAPAKKPRRRSKKAAPTPAETMSENELDEEATEKAPKAKAAARRARKKATEPVETTTTTATAPANDGLITALKERVSSLERELDAHKTTFEVREANSKSKISTLESKLESSQAELAACREALTERDEQLADKDETIDGFEFANETLSTSLESLKNQLAVAENTLIEEKAENKTPSTGRPQTSPLRDATNA